MGDFFGTRIEIWAGFGPVGINEKKEKIWANYEELFMRFFQAFIAKKTVVKENVREKVLVSRTDFLPWEILLIKNLDFKKTKST